MRRLLSLASGANKNPDVFHLPLRDAANPSIQFATSAIPPPFFDALFITPPHARLFGEFDRSLAFSREVFGPARAATSPGSLDGSGGNNDQVGSGGPAVASENSDREKTLWKEAWRKAEERGEDECPICMCSMMPVFANDSDGNDDDNDDDNTEKHGAQEKGATGVNKQVGPPPNTEETAAAFLATQRGRTTDVEVVVVEEEEGQGERGQGEGRGVPRGRQHMAGDEGGGTTKATQKRRRRRRQGDAGNQRERLLLSCSHVFHKAVSPSVGLTIRRANV